MYFNLEAAKKYVQELDKVRFNQALSDSSYAFRHVFQLISLLLHANHPALPGYLPNAPQGIAGFTLSDYQKQFLSVSVAKSRFEDTVKEFNTRADYTIDALYVMGSISSITQTSSSDLDIWLCHIQDLDSNDLRLLEQKTLLLQEWAKTYQIDINIFLMDQQSFKHKHRIDELCGENCGSSQYMLLLEEFYRSSIRLAGKPLLWLHVYTENEHEYENQVKRLVEEGKVDLSEWVDFGGLGRLSANEYFGAILWLLNKSIAAPYKSALKILLLEVYSQEYPNTQLIALDFKRRLLQGEAVEGFDPYIAMLDKVTEYLTALGDTQRLDFVRRCFYLKASEDIVHFDQKNNWRICFLQRLIKDWQWPQKKIDDLNNRPFWKIKRVKKSYEMLMSMLMLSYRNLVNFGRKYHVDASIMPQDIYILTRKLYTAFEELPNKINLFNLQMSHNLSEKHLTFVQVENSSVHQPGWYLINQAPFVNAFSNLRYVKYHRNLSYLVAYAYFNGLFTVKTQLHISSSTVTLAALRQFFTDLRLSLAKDTLPAQNEDLQRSYEIRHVMIGVNLTDDPTRRLVGEPRMELQASDLFSFGPEQQSLLGSIDLIFRNSWNEVHTHHFSGSNAILQALKMLSHKTFSNSLQTAGLNIFCYSHRYGLTLKAAVSELVQKILNRNNNEHSPTVRNLRVAGKTWQLFFAERGINLQEIIGERSKNSENLADNRGFTTTNTVKGISQKYPTVINSFASEGFMQFFFEDNNDDTFNVYILDEMNHLEIYRHCEGSKMEKVKEINHIYTVSSVDDGAYRKVAHKFNYPQFYQLINENGSIKVELYSQKR
ncbi:adenylate cyclase [Cricetibacter osteomyelitidis]|uniref:Adenylate cyclase n=1 Tax=Cricetibacter osteomyelitidis TaxID=1521931 RepID=A0A4R2T7K5_9PAST|nr:class I adenylate cyclase [Cricetibacter osteomyelitidis]TCP96834.1 adenylate cyclase [Cricetibacter osteomyelitidis]